MLPLWVNLHLLNLAIAEKGLVVFDAVVKGTPSHAAHPNNDNSIYNTIKVLEWFKDYSFEKSSDVLGEVKVNGHADQSGFTAQCGPSALPI